MPTEIRFVRIDEIAAFHRAISTTFLEDAPPDPARTHRRAQSWISERAWAAVDAGQIVGTLQTLPAQLSVPGFDGATVDIAADALTAVTVAATHRRQGLLRRMLGESLDVAKERGDSVSVLLAAQWPIYGRFGYWPASRWQDVTVDRRRPGAVLRVPVTGSLRTVQDQQLHLLAPAIFAVARTQRAGQLDRPALFWDLHLDADLRGSEAKPHTLIAHEGPTGVDGYLRWRPTRQFDWDAGGSVRVEELIATNQDAYTALWGYLFGLDVVDEITLAGRPIDEPLPLLMVDGRCAKTTALLDSVWLRVLDVAAALSARGYACAGRLGLEIVDDDHGGYASGRYLLECDGVSASCVRAPTARVDLRLSQRALAAVYLGQPSLRMQQAAGLVTQVSAGAINRGDAMFGTALAPWTATSF
jgi:predicted acetyltransferase